MTRGAAEPVVAAPLGEARTEAVRSALLAWYDKNKRDLPWRRTSDPYAIWLSETMLQQTRVETVIPYWERFLERFPTVEALAEADEEEITRLWAGLGYYSRARNLHRAAQRVRDDFGGALPDGADLLRELPGVGRYTAGAVASIAFDRREPVVDGNVIRVLTRVTGLREDVKRARVQERIWQEAGALADGPRPGDLNQALMELGATLCTPRAPRCLVCPLSPIGACDAAALGDADALPIKTKKKAPVPFEAVAAWVERRGKVLAARRPDEGLMAGMWELPGGDLLEGETPEAGLRRTLRERFALDAKTSELVGEVEHVFSHRRLRLHVFRCGPVRGRIALEGPSDHRWVSQHGFADLPHGAAVRKALALLAPGR